MSDKYASQVVGIDLHRRRSVMVRQDAAGGERLSVDRVDNDDSVAFARVIEAGGPRAPVVLEATYGWYWAADMLDDLGAEVHLAHPLGCVGFKHRRRKDDVADASDLADLLRMGRLPEAWIAPPAVRELRELVRYRHKLVALRSNAKAQVHGVLAKQGVHIRASDLFGATGRVLLGKAPLDAAYAQRVASLLDLIDVFDTHVDRFEALAQARLADDAGYHAIQAIPGVGAVLAAVFTAEIGDVGRFERANKLCCWAGLTPRHYESDTTVHTGHITKQGSRLVRWAALEAIQRKTTPKIAADRARIEDRRGNNGGRNIAKVAAARKLLTLVYYGLRDGHIRALSPRQEAA